MKQLRLGAAATIALTLMACGICLEARAEIIGVLEEPATGGDCSGIRNIRGWAFSATGAELVQPFSVFVDDDLAIEIPCCSSRGDVQGTFPSAPVRSGFSGVLNFQLLAPGEHAVRVEIASKTGEHLSVQSTCTSHRFGSATFSTHTDLDNDGAGFCESDLNDPNLICCEGIRVESGGNAQECGNVCYRWDRGTQGLVQTSGPLFAEPLCDPAQ